MAWFGECVFRAIQTVSEGRSQLWICLNLFVSLLRVVKGETPGAYLVFEPWNWCAKCISNRGIKTDTGLYSLSYMLYFVQYSLVNERLNVEIYLRISEICPQVGNLQPEWCHAYLRRVV